MLPLVCSLSLLLNQQAIFLAQGSQFSLSVSRSAYSSSFLIFQGSSFLVLLFMQVLCAWFYERVGQFAPEEIVASSVLVFTSQGILELRKGKEGKVLLIKRLISSSF